jgi:signal transduction histidine kinase/CheY-like chemotaxis protein
MDRVDGESHQERTASADDIRGYSLNSLITRISIDFLRVKPDRVDEAVDRTLAVIATYLEAHRSFVVLLSEGAEPKFDFAFDCSPDGKHLSNHTDAGIGTHHLPVLHAILSEDKTADWRLSNGQPPGADAELNWLRSCDFQATVIVPLRDETGLIGAIGVGSSDASCEWPKKTITLLRIIGEIIVTALDRKAAHDALQGRIEAEEVIRSIATLVIELTADQLDEGYSRALATIGQFLNIDRGYVRMTGLSESSRPYIAGWRAEHSVPFDDEMRSSSIFNSFPWAFSVISKNENIVMNSWDDLPDEAAPEKKYLQKFDVVAEVVAPILANDKLVGILVCDMNYAPRKWSDIDVMLISIVAQILGGMRVRQQVDEERKRLESQVQHAQKLESMGVLAGGIAHDFNNLLVGILGNAELMLMNSPQDLPRRKNLEQIESSARRAGDLVNQLLTYTGKGHFKVEPLDATQLVESLTALVRTVIPKKIDVQVELEDDLPLVDGDAMQLRQTIMNLITNAADAIGEDKGKVLLYTGIGTFNDDYLQQTIAGAELQSGDYVIIEVTDTGCGMDEPTKAKIFDPFFTTKFAGRGLGLAATLGIVRAHRGTLKVMSWPQKGTTVQVLLPATAHKRPEPSTAPVNLEVIQDGGTVLVIDDEISVRRVTRSVLEHFGYDVLVAENGIRALRMLEQNPNKVDLVILDMSMPKMDGEETLRRIRELGEQVPVVLTSGYTEVEISDRFETMEASAFIGKPFSPKDLIQQVRKLL